MEDSLCNFSYNGTNWAGEIFFEVYTAFIESENHCALCSFLKSLYRTSLRLVTTYAFPGKYF